MSREAEGRRMTGERSRRDGARYSAADETPYGRDPADPRSERFDTGAERPAPVEEIEPNRVEVERRTGAERRVADQPVDIDRRQADRRAARQQAQLEARERRYHVAGRATQAVDYLFYLLYGLLATRFVLSLLGASEQAGFVQFIQGVTNPFYAPFANIVARPAVNGGYLDFPLLIAVLAYALLHMAIRGLIRLLAGRPAVP
jgi:YggT family protein